MLGSKNAGATLAVTDLERARDFYENTLGLDPLQEDLGSVLYKSGNSVVLVYPSEYAGTNQATAATWAVGDDFDATIQDLKAKVLYSVHNSTFDLAFHTWHDPLDRLADRPRGRHRATVAVARRVPPL